MATTRIISLTRTPLDIIASETLEDGDYTVSNESPFGVIMAFRPEPVDEPTEVEGGHTLPSRSYIGITVTSGQAFYVWSYEDMGTVAVTEVNG